MRTIAKQLQELRTTLSLDNDDFRQSAKQTQSDLKSLRSEMNFVKSGGKEYARSLEGMKKQSDILNRTLQTQGKRLDAIKKKYDAAVKASGENSAEARKLQAQYNNVAAQMRKTETRLEGLNKAIDDQSNKWKKASKRAQEVGDDFQKMGSKLNDVGDSLSQKVTAPMVAFGALAVETTREFREDLAKLETNAKQAGIGVDVTSEAMKDLNAITGETDSNVEALSNLMATGMNSNQLKQAVDDLSGAVIRFPDTLKIEGLADGLQETLATGKAIGPFAELLERMGVDLKEFDKGLAESKESGDELNYVLGKLNDLDLSKVNDEFRETNKEIVEAREAQYDFQESLAELGQTLEPIATRLTDALTDVMDRFNELNPEAQETVLQVAGLAAAAGPAIKMVGGLSTGVGKLFEMSGKLTSKLGKAGGAGMLGRLGLLGAAGGPVGLGIAAFGGLSLAIYKAVEASKEKQKVTDEQLESMQGEMARLDELTGKYGELRNKNRLSNDEMLEFMDIADELKETSAPDTIAQLRDRQAELLEKSGFTNDEMQTFIGLNDEIIEQAPGVKTAISDEGNAYIETFESLQKLNAEKRQQLESETYSKITEELGKQSERYQQQKDLVSEIENGMINQQHQQDIIFENSQIINESKRELRQLEDEILGTEGETRKELERQIEKHQGIIAESQTEKRDAETLLGKHTEIVGEKQKKLDKIREELKGTEDLLYDYEQIVLSGVDINAEKGKGLQKIDEEIGKLQAAKRENDDLLAKEKISIGQHQERNSELDGQIGKLRDAQGELREMNSLAAEDIDKDIYIKESPTLGYWEQQLTKPLSKTVNIKTNGLNLSGMYVDPYSYAEGTDYHPGGPAIVGEEGPELAKMGNKWSMLDFGMTNLPRGTQVFTHEETTRMLNALNRIPAYADGISRSGEADRLINNLQSRSNGGITQNITINSPEALSPYETARRQKQAARQLAMEW